MHHSKQLVNQFQVFLRITLLCSFLRDEFPGAL